MLRKTYALFYFYGALAFCCQSIKLKKTAEIVFDGVIFHLHVVMRLS